MGLYEELREHYSSRFEFEEKKIENLFREIEKYISPSVIYGFYPKNLFAENKEVEFYVFLANKLIILQSNKNEYVFTSIRSIKNLVNYNIERALDYDRIQKVIFEFLNQETIIFEPQEDTNYHWRQCFSEELEIISKSIIGIW